ncbi:MAG: FadR/GntR family transcriptional regulator [Pseudomonadota bacterium]
MNARDITVDLRQRIVLSQYPADSRLPAERALADEYGVARGTVREALKILEKQGLVETRAGSGTYVTESPAPRIPSVIETTRPLELVDARYALEPHMVRLAVLHGTEQDLVQAETHLTDMEAMTDYRGFADMDEKFHMALADAARNPMIKWMMQKCHEVRSHAQWSRMRTLTLTPAIILLYNRQHREIVDAIRARDADGAARAMREHLSTARQSLVEATI